MIDDMKSEPCPRCEEVSPTDTITTVIWTVVGLVLIGAPLVMVSLV